MTDDARRFLVLNAAQRRSLRNWTVEERPSRAVEIVIPTPGEPSLDTVRQLAIDLMRAHEALRSRLAEDDDGELCQLVRPLDEAIADFAVETEDIADDRTDADVMSWLWPQPVDPELHALRCLAYLRAGRVRVLMFSVSHLFADGVSAMLLTRAINAALDSGAPVQTAARQAGDFAGDRTADAVRANTDAWRERLTGAPRRALFSPVERQETEEIRGAQVTLSPQNAAMVRELCRSRRMTPYAVWCAVTDMVVSRSIDRAALVFKTQVSNRHVPADFGAVAQIAQAAWVPVPGTDQDTVAERAAAVFTASMAVQDIGIHDTVELLAWLDSPAVRGASAFRPAFEINFGAPVGGVQLPQMTCTPDRMEFQEKQRFDPGAAAADFSVSVWQEPDTTVVTLRTKPPVWRGREPLPILDDLVAVLETLYNKPESRVADLPVAPYPDRGTLLRIGDTDVDEAMQQRLLTAHPHAVSATFSVVGNDLTAAVVVDRPVADAELMDTYVERQRWLEGTVVPASLVVSAQSGGASPSCSR